MPVTIRRLAQLGPRHVIVCDYIAGMTDQFLLRQHEFRRRGHGESATPRSTMGDISGQRERVLDLLEQVTGRSNLLVPRSF